MSAGDLIIPIITGLAAGASYLLGDYDGEQEMKDEAVE